MTEILAAEAAYDLAGPMGRPSNDEGRQRAREPRRSRS